MGVRWKIDNVYKVKEDGYHIEIPYLSFELPILSLCLGRGARIKCQRVDPANNMIWFFIRAKGITLSFGLDRRTAEKHLEMYDGGT